METEGSNDFRIAEEKTFRNQELLQTFGHERNQRALKESGGDSEGEGGHSAEREEDKLVELAVPSAVHGCVLQGNP